MPEMTGTIMYVNPPKPGQRSGSLKLDNNERVGILGDQVHLFQRGQRVAIVYKDRAGSDGRWWKDFVGFAGEQGSNQSNQYAPPPPTYAPPQPVQVSRPAAPRPPAPPPPTMQRPPAPAFAGPKASHDYNTGKQICVTGITQRFVQAGTTPATDIPVVMRLIAETYDSIFNPQQQASQQSRPVPAAVYGGQPAGPRDEIPFDDSVEDLGQDYDPNAPPF